MSYWGTPDGRSIIDSVQKIIQKAREIAFRISDGSNKNAKINYSIPIFKDLTFRTPFELLDLCQEGFDRNDSGKLWSFFICVERKKPGAYINKFRLDLTS